MKCVVLLLCILAAARSQTTDSQRQEGKDKASQITSGLYITLRNVAFPDHELTDGTAIESRFLMLMPGKVLNYFDYFPGKDYTNFIQDLDVNRAESVVPPHVMEKWFDIADAIPSYNPMNAQDSGKSLANVYSSILHETKLQGLQAKTKSERALFTQAMDFLNQSVADPDDAASGVRVPLLTLYERYRDNYNDRKLAMEDLIDKKRRSLGSLDYELWFQRQYPSLQSKVESAYTKWLIFGQKESVELYVTYMDTGSSGTQLEEARMALRGSGVSSLDRTRTIYPVSFEPSDWYKYLLPEVQMPSRDQLQLMLGKTQSKMMAIDEIINATRTNTAITDIYNEVKGAYDSKSLDSKTHTTEYMNYQISCLKESEKCKDYDAKRESAIDAMQVEAEAFSTYQFAQYFKNPADYISNLEKEKAQLTSQARRIEGYLGGSSPYLGGLIDTSSLSVSNLTDAYKDNEWLQFDYDFESYFNNKDEETTTEAIRKSWSVHVLFIHAGGESSYNKNTHDYNEKLAQSNMRVKGELLRVNIKRPWFKPEVFEIPDLTFRESGNGGEAFVSPGLTYTESSFFDVLTNSNQQFKLPEFTTGFLLARNIELEFSGVDSETVTSTMNEMSHSSGGGGFLCFRASVSKTKTRDTSHIQVKRTANGMSIKIPGAQIIGYYTKILPKFPLNQQ